MEYKIKNRKISLNEISKILNIKYLGKNCFINGLNYSDQNSIYDSILVYCQNKKYLKIAMGKKHISAVIINNSLYTELNEDDKQKKSFFLTDDPKFTFFKLHNYLSEESDFYNDFIYYISNHYSSTISHQPSIINHQSSIIIIKVDT